MPPLAVRCLVPLLASLAVAGRALAAVPVATEVRIEVAGGSLHGTLLAPAEIAGPPIVLILAGSGPTDRDGNQSAMQNDSLKQLAEALAERGIASLRTDKRGIGASAGAVAREADLRFDDYVADAAGWLAFLRGRKDVGPVFALGHSEGALVATLAAERVPVAGLVLVAGAGFPIGTVLRRQFDEAHMPAAKREQAEAMLRRIEAGQTIAEVPPEWLILFRSSAQPYLISWARHDPAAALARVAAPALVVQGSNDIQASRADAERLAASRRGIRLVLIEGMNHVLKTAPADRAANAATYADPTLPIRPEMVDAVEGFVRSNTGKAAR